LAALAEETARKEDAGRTDSQRAQGDFAQVEQTNLVGALEREQKEAPTALG
jgi:hypothetical protein